MDCVNHSGKTATAFCQNCGKGLCADCISAGLMRGTSGGQILCDNCIATWQNVPPPFVGSYSRTPNPVLAGILGLIPGVGAMYNGQFFKGLVHVVVFAVLISISEHYKIFGLFIAAWILYQAFEAYHTALAMRDGQPPPDPLGLNELSNWLNLGAKPQEPSNLGSYDPGAGRPAAQGQPPYAGQAPPQPPAGQWQNPYTPPIGGVVDRAAARTPFCGGGREPIGAFILIGLGVLFLLGQLDFFRWHLFHFVGPLMLIGLGIWLIVRNIESSGGGSK
jgi:hypothetical protein